MDSGYIEQSVDSQQAAAEEFTLAAGVPLPAEQAADLIIIHGTRPGVEQIASATLRLLRENPNAIILITGGMVKTTALHEKIGGLAGLTVKQSEEISEARHIFELMQRMGMTSAEATQIELEENSLHTGQNIELGLTELAQRRDLSCIRNIVSVGKPYAGLRYLQTLKHWLHELQATKAIPFGWDDLENVGFEPVDIHDQCSEAEWATANYRRLMMQEVFKCLPTGDRSYVVASVTTALTPGDAEKLNLPSGHPCFSEEFLIELP